MSVQAGQCDPGRIADFLDRRLSELEQAVLEEHLGECSACRESLGAQTADAELWDKASRYLRDDGYELDPTSGTEFTSAPHDRSLSINHVIDALAPTDDPDMLGRLGAYEVSGVVGSGGMGVVLKGLDKSLDRTVSIKVLAPHLASSGAARKRFAREAKAAAAVLHPNVMAIHSVSNDESLPYLVMPYLRGPSLQKRLDSEGPLPVSEILRIGSQIAAGLAAAHAQGLVHRDIKPANILLEEGVERVAITDFGLARAVDDATMTRTGVIAGTPQYMSPEQARGESVDQRSDLFSLGSVLYAMCTGRAPFRAETSYGVMRRIIDEEPRPIREINPDIPDWLCQIVATLTSKRPDDRFASAGEVAECLEQCLAHVQQPTTVPLPAGISKPRSEQGMQPPSRIRRVALAIASGFLFVVAGIVIVLELNKGTLTIEADEAGIPIRIMKGNEVCEELTVTPRNKSVRLAAGQYVVEIAGEHDGLQVESDGGVVVTRGEKELVKITRRDSGDQENPSKGNAEVQAPITVDFVVIGFHLAYFDPAPGLVEELVPGSDRKVYVEMEPVAKHADVASARVIDDSNGSPAIEVTFNEESAERLREVTERHRGKPLAIYVDGKLLSVPTIREGFANKAVITGRFSREEAERIATGLIAISERRRYIHAGDMPLWRQFGVTPAPVSPLTAQVLEWIGLHLRPITKEHFREKNVLAAYAGGLDVTFVRTGGPAETAGIHEVDIVIGLLGRPVVSLQDLDSAMQDAVEQIQRKDTDTLQFDVLRYGETVRVNVPFPAGKLTQSESETGSDSNPATQPAVLVSGANDASSQLIRSKAKALWKELRGGWDDGDGEPIRGPILIQTSISEDDARGMSTFRVDDDGCLRDVKIELAGNLDGIIKDALPRQLSHIVLACRIGIPPRWAEMGIGLLSESLESRQRNLQKFEEFRDAGRLLPTAKLLGYTEYPKQPETARVMYVQSMAIAGFIIETWDWHVLVAFAADTKNLGASRAISAHLSFDTVGDFDIAFRQWEPSSPAADRPSIEQLIQAFGRHEQSYLPYHVKVMETFRMNEGLSAKEKRRYPWADGQLHQKRMEYAQRELGMWMRKETMLLNDSVQAQFDQYNSEEQLIKVSERPGSDDGLQVRLEQDEYRARMVSPTPYAGLFPLAVYSDSALLSDAIAAGKTKVQLNWEKQDAVLGFEFGWANAPMRFHLWLSREHDWHPIRLQRFITADHKQYLSEWRATRLLKEHGTWRVKEGTMAWRHFEDANNDGAQVMYFVDFEVLATEFGDAVSDDVLRYEIPRHANVHGSKTQPTSEPIGRTRPMKVNVVGVDGEPIRGATIRFQTKRSEEIESVVTDNSGVGRTKKAPMDLVITVTAPNHRSTSWIIGPRGNESSAILAPATSGTTKDVTGAPISEVWITSESLWFRQDGLAEIPRHETASADNDWSDESGEFTLTTELRVRRADEFIPVMAIDDAVQNMALTLVPASGLGSRLDLTLKPVCHVQGEFIVEGVAKESEFDAFVEDETGLQLARVTPSVQFKDNKAHVAFKLRLHEGTYLLKSQRSSLHSAFSVPLVVRPDQRQLDFGTIAVKAGGMAALIGKSAPELSVKTRSGEKLSLADLRGNVIVLDFWGHWCLPCVREMPGLMKVAEQFKEQPVRWITIHDPSLSTFEQLDEQIARLETEVWKGKMSLETVIDLPNNADNRIGMTGERFGIREWPTLVIIDTDGRVVGVESKVTLPVKLEELLAKSK